MENDFRDKQRKNYVMMRMVYDFTMALLILLMGAVMLFGDKFGNEPMKEFIGSLDVTIRYLFGGLCILYGAFRLYRGIKHDY